MIDGRPDREVTMPDEEPIATLIPHPESDPASLFHPNEQLIPLWRRKSIWYEQLQKLRTTLLDVAKERHLPAKVLLITSSIPGEGKTLIALNLALTLHQSGVHRVLFIEADLRKPRLSDLLKRHPRYGLSEILRGTVQLDRALEEFRGSGFRMLTAGQIEPDAVGALESSRLQEVIAAARERNEHVILDAPPWLPFPDASILSRHADGILLLVRMGSTSREMLLKSLQSIDRKQLLGVVANGAEMDDTHGYYKYYHPAGHDGE